MEAALRSAYYLVTGENCDADAFKDVRGLDGWKEASFDIAGYPSRGCGERAGQRQPAAQRARGRRVSYDCRDRGMPGGCSGGGGLPSTTARAGRRSRRRPVGS